MSKVLLDTHAVLWFISRDFQLSPTARTAIEGNGCEVFVSLASIWEIAIKHSLGKLSLKLQLVGEFPEFLQQNGFILLPIEFAHAVGVASLAHHHGDPFDRLLVSQSLIENMPLVSHDKRLDDYGIRRIW
jgi:PIN domain nuclease of toxin-antitoxin system